MKKLSIALLVTAMSSTALAATYTASSPYAETHGITKYKMHSYIDRVSSKSTGDIAFDVHSGGVLLPANSALSGLSNGVAHYGHVTSAYVPSDLRYDNVLNDLAFIADDPLAAALAVTEVKLSNKLLQNEYKAEGVVFGSGYSMTNYYLICKDEITTPEELKGKRIRTGSSSQIQWVQYMNAVSVSVPATEIYTGLQRGNIDCALGDASFLTTSFKLQEVAKNVTLISLGTHTSGGEFFNINFWEGLNNPERELLFSELAYAIAELQVSWAAQAESSLEEATANNVALHQPSEALQFEVNKFQSEFINNLAEASMERRGVEDPSMMIEEYLQSERKWKELLVDVERTDVEALAELIRSELYSELNLDQYGM